MMGPCKNPNCSSFGRPHPNCKCYGNMAAGGEVTHFCASNTPHEKACKYFAEGGEVPADDLPEMEPNEATKIPSASVEVPADDLPPTGAGTNSEVPENDLPEKIVPDSEKYSTLPQRGAAAIEGAVQGIPLVGPLATAGEIGLSKMGDYLPYESGLKGLGLSAGDIKARTAANPVEHSAGKMVGLAGSMLPSFGAGVAKTGVEALRNLLGKSALEGATIQGSNEATNWLLGDQDPEHPVGASLLNIGAGVLFGLVSGGIAHKAGSKLAELANRDLGSKIAPFLVGIGMAAKGMSPKNLSEEANMAEKIAGANFYNSLSSKLIPHMTGGIGALEGAREGYHDNGVVGAAEGAVTGAGAGALAGIVGKNVVEKLSRAIGKNAVEPFIAKILSSGHAEGLGDAVNYATQVGGGLNKLNSRMDGLFSVGKAIPQEAWDAATVNERREKLKDYIENGGFQQHIDDTIQDHNEEGVPDAQELLYAEGGEVKQKEPKKRRERSIIKDNDGMAMHFPMANMGLTAAKDRISNYLLSQRPQKNTPQLAFDDAPDDREEKRNYNRALDMANQPLSILNQIQNGTVEPSDVKHFQSMFPEANQLIQKSLTDKIIKSQLDGKKPSYKVRQGMSLLMGTPLSGDLSPQNIQAAQAVFQQKGAPQNGQGQTQAKRSTGGLSDVNEQYLTAAQARQKQQQK